MPRIQTAKLFMNGRSQAVRLPQEFRFEGEEVRIHREGNRVILEPVTFDADGWLGEIAGLAEEGDFMPQGREQPVAQDREPLE
ncbi:MAG: antitoxin [Caenispirillum bisanense]|nr:antitoxin [Caenispirillum bisanense]